jgi:hypothetical protein
MRDQSCGRRNVSVPFWEFRCRKICAWENISAYLVEVDDGLPELVLELVEVPHTNLTEVTRVVLVDVGTVVVLTTGHTATTGRLAVLADTTFTGRDMATVLAGLGETGRHCGGFGVVVGSKSSLVKVQICVAREVLVFQLWSATCQGEIVVA